MIGPLASDDSRGVGGLHW